MNPKRPIAATPMKPHVYRPQPVPRVLQRKSALTQAPKPPLATRPVSVQRKLPAAAPVYRPNTVPKVLQTKQAPFTAKVQVKRGPVIQPKTQSNSSMANSPSTRSVIQRTNAIYHSQRAGKGYEIKRRSHGGKYYLDMVEEGKSAVLANMRYSFYGDGMAVMEHVEAYGMPGGTRAAYLLFFLFADHALKEGYKMVGIGTGVTETSVERNLREARERGDRRAAEEAQRSQAAVHIYKEFGFNARDAMTLSHSSMTVMHIRTVALQKTRGYWRVRPNLRPIIEGFRRMIAQIRAPLPPDHQVFNLPNAITNEDL